MTIAYLGLGSNVGRRARNLSAARRRLRSHGVQVLRVSHVIDTAPWGDTDQPRFLNQVLEVAWPGSAHQLHAVLQAVEEEGGRQPTRRWGPRVIDVDLLLFGDERINDEALTVPHPGIRERDFVKIPLAELGVRAGRW